MIRVAKWENLKEDVRLLYCRFHPSCQADPPNNPNIKSNQSDDFLLRIPCMPVDCECELSDGHCCALGLEVARAFDGTTAVE